jgi:hypothetical protein
MKPVEFRDGIRKVPDAVADHLARYETYTMTYKDAMRLMNDRFMVDRINKAQSDAVAQHLARFRR